MAMNPPTTGGAGSAMPEAIYWFGAWIVFLVVLYLLAKTKPGATIVGGLIWLTILYILLTRSQDISTLFQAGNLTAGQV